MFVYCASGGRSRAAAERLAALGFEQVFDLTGGITAWSRAGLPIVRPENGAPPAPTTTPAAFDAAILSARVVLVDFQTPWCGPCRELAPVMEVVEHDYAGRVTVLRVDVDSSEALATREHIEGVPLLALYVQGRETWRARGVASRDAIASQLDAALASTTPAAGERR
jgi:thioredoxin